MTEHEVVNSVKRTIESALKIPFDRIDEDAEFRSFGMDSIVAMEVVSKLSRNFSIQISPAEFTQVNTVKELAIKISESCDGQSEQAESQRQPQTAGNPAAAALRRSDTSKGPAKRLAPGYRSVRRVQGANANPIDNLVDKIRNKFSIDLSGTRFSSVNDVIDRLVSDYSEHLVEFYSRSRGPVQGELARLVESRVRQAGDLGSPARSRDVAIIGIACRFPDADDAGQFWENLIAGKSSIREIPASRWSTEEHYSNAVAEGKSSSRWAALIEDFDCFDPAFFNMPKSLAGLIDPQERLLLQETYRAFQDACLDPASLSGSNTGLFVGYEYLEYEQSIRKGQANGAIKGLPPLTSSSLNYYLANRLSYLFDFHGPSESVNVNCASSAVAVNRAQASLVLGECDVAVAGGVSLNIFSDDYVALSQQGLLSPTGTCAVFDDAADGYTRGEGVGVVILKRLEDAERDNDRIYAVIKSSRQNNRGHADTISSIDHRSITRVIQDCYGTVSVPTDSVNYIELNGYAKKWGDAFEFEGIKNAFSASTSGRKHCALGSLKGNIGHLEPVNGVAALIKLALSLHHKVFPPTTTIKNLNEFINLEDSTHPLFLADKPIEFDQLRDPLEEPIRAGINSFADSGTNVHILLEEYCGEEVGETGAKGSLEPELFVLSARTPGALQISIKQYVAFVEENGDKLNFNDLIYSLQVGRESMGCRLAVIARGNRELVDKLQLILDSGTDAIATLQRQGIYYGDVQQSDVTRDNLQGLISHSVTDLQLRHSLESRQWHETALLWVNGLSLSWKSIWEGRSARPTSLPGYPFARERCWLDQVEAGDLRMLGGQNVEHTGRQTTLNSGLVPADRRTTDKVARIWSEVLDIDVGKLGTNRSFFELGGDSQSALRLMSTINEHFNEKLSPADLFDFPTISRLASKLEERSSQSVVQFARPAGQGVVVPIQKAGSRNPVFALPGAGGSVMCLHALSEALGTKQPFYGLQSIGLDGACPPLKTIEEMAEVAITAAREIQAEGPYHLLGYSNGGVVAFHMAQYFQAEGDEVASLILLDSVSPLQRRNNVTEEMVKVCNDLLDVLGSDRELEIQEFADIQESKLMDHLYGILSSEGFNLPKTQFATSFNVIMASDNACRIYKPSRFEGQTKVHLFRAANGYPELPSDYGWGELFSVQLKVHDLDVDHLSIITGDSIRTIAQRLKRILRQSESDVAVVN